MGHKLVRGCASGGPKLLGEQSNLQGALAPVAAAGHTLWSGCGNVRERAALRDDMAHAIQDSE